MSNNNTPSSAAAERNATLRIELEYEGDEPGTTETTTIVAHGTEWDMRQLDARLKFLHSLEKSGAPDAANAGEPAADLALAAETYLIAVDGFEDACRVDGETPGGADELYETAKDNLAKARATLEAEIFAARKAGK